MTDARNSLDEAIAWQVRLTSGDADAATYESFTAWLEEDEAHRAVFDRVEALDAGFASLDPAMIERAAHISGTRGVRRWRANYGFVAAGAVVATAVVLAMTFYTRNGTPAQTEIATRIGETRSVTLADGTTVDLDSATRLTVNSADPRRAILDSGEALFHVAKVPGKAFVVTVAGREVRDLATVFDIRHVGSDVSVVVAEGAVAVDPVNAGPDAAVKLVPGDRLAWRAGEASGLVTRVDPAKALSWREGYLVYDNAPLSEIVVDLNRHFAGRISLDGPAVAGLRFSGVLRLDQEAAVLQRIARFLPVTVEQHYGGTYVLHGTSRGD
ncbi:MAG: FecR family protein [Rhizomicrobium sp.]